MNPRSFASSHTGNRGQEVRQASRTSAYGRDSAPIHSSKSTISASTGSDIIALLFRDCSHETVSWYLGSPALSVGQVNHQRSGTHPLERLCIFLAPCLTQRFDRAAHEALPLEALKQRSVLTDIDGELNVFATERIRYSTDKVHHRVPLSY